MAGCAARGAGNREEQRDLGVDQAACEPKARECKKAIADGDFLLRCVHCSERLRGPAPCRAQLASTDSADSDAPGE